MSEKERAATELLLIKERLAKALVTFVERAVKENATAEEIEVLPAVARVLCDLT